MAVKVPFMEFESDPGFFSRFQREEEIGTRLHHPNILRFIPEEEGEQRSRPYIVTEYLRGYTLAHLLNSIRPMPEKDALKHQPAASVKRSATCMAWASSTVT